MLILGAIIILVLMIIIRIAYPTWLEDKYGKSSTNPNIKYENIMKIQCYEQHDPSTDVSSWLPLPGSYTGRYVLEANATTRTTVFTYAGHKYGTEKDSSYNEEFEIKSAYNIEKFIEVCDLIYVDTIENYEFKSDESGKIVSSPEEYFFIIQYYDKTAEKLVDKAIKTPSKTNEIVKVLDDMLVENAENKCILEQQ